MERAREWGSAKAVRSVRVYLLALVALSVLVATAAFAIVARSTNEVNRRQTEAQTLETAKALSRAVDQELERAIGVLSALRASEAAVNRDWRALDRQARAVTGRDAWILVQDRDGQQLVNTRLPVGAPLPRGRPPQQMWRELGTGKPRVCNLVTGIVERQIVCVDRRFEVQGSRYAMSMVFLPRAFSRVITREAAHQGHIAALVDRSGTVIWRNRRSAEFVGQKGTGTILDSISSQRQSGVA